MTPNNEGRYCNSCAKTVIDFTLMTDEEVQQFFFDHQHQAICGHFKRSQVHRIVIDLPDNILTVKMPAWMRFLVACLLIFGISMFPFETTIAGKLPSEISSYQGEPMVKKKDTIPIIKKKILRPDEAVETNMYYDGGVGSLLPLIFEKRSKKTKAKPDSIKSCAPKDSLKNDSLKTALLKDPKIPRQKKQTDQKEKESIEFIFPALLPGKEETNTEIMD
jgi:hypothetical protein